MGETYQWVVNDAQVITTGEIDQGPITIRVGADMNGYSWQVSRNANLINGFPQSAP